LIHVFACLHQVKLCKKGGDKCTARTLPEDNLILSTITAFKKMLTDKKEFLNRLMLAIEEGVEAKDSRSLFDIEEELDQLQLQLIARTSSKEEYNDLVEKIYTLKDEKERVLLEESGKENHKKNLQAIKDFIKTQDVDAFEFDDKLVRQFVEKILVLDETIEVTFKTGTCVRIAG
jgi:site-specific DNA recombinase